MQIADKQQIRSTYDRLEASTTTLRSRVGLRKNPNVDVDSRSLNIQSVNDEQHLRMESAVDGESDRA